MKKPLPHPPSAWNPYYLAFCRAQGRSPTKQLDHDRENGPSMMPFIFWMKERYAEWAASLGYTRTLHGSYPHEQALLAVGAPVFAAYLEGLYPRPSSLSPCCEATIGASLGDGVLLGTCADCRTVVRRRNPLTGVDEWLDGKSPWTKEPCRPAPPRGASTVAVFLDDEASTRVDTQHDPLCDTLDVDPAIGRPTKPCNCPAGLPERLETALDLVRRTNEALRSHRPLQPKKSRAARARPVIATCGMCARCDDTSPRQARSEERRLATCRHPGARTRPEDALRADDVIEPDSEPPYWCPLREETPT